MSDQLWGVEVSKWVYRPMDGWYMVPSWEAYVWAPDRESAEASVRRRQSRRIAAREAEMTPAMLQEKREEEQHRAQQYEAMGWSLPADTVGRASLVNPRFINDYMKMMAVRWDDDI